MKFNIGDIVKLKSGGPDMTVNRLPGYVGPQSYSSDYQCQWFNEKDLRIGNFHENSLVFIK